MPSLLDIIAAHKTVTKEVVEEMEVFSLSDNSRVSITFYYRVDKTLERAEVFKGTEKRRSFFGKMPKKFISSIAYCRENGTVEEVHQFSKESNKPVSIHYYGIRGKIVEVEEARFFEKNQRAPSKITCYKRPNEEYKVLRHLDSREELREINYYVIEETGNKRLEATEFFRNGEINPYQINRYKTDGKTLEKTEFLREGQERSYTNYYYRQNKTLERAESFISGKLTPYEKIFYDKYGKTVERTETPWVGVVKRNEGIEGSTPVKTFLGTSRTQCQAR